MSERLTFNLIAVPAIAFHVMLLAFFALRRVAFQTALRWGWVVYALSVPAAIVSAVLMRAGVWWPYWLGGLLYLLWGALGYLVEYVLKIEWRRLKRWPILAPYLSLYLATAMFYWWPVGLLSRRLWFLLAALFVVSSVLNLSSHRRTAGRTAQRGSAPPL